MTIQEDLLLHFETIAAWINSCISENQIPICKEAIQTFIVQKFTGKVDQLELEIQAKELEALTNMKLREIRYYTDKPPKQCPTTIY